MCTLPVTAPLTIAKPNAKVSKSKSQYAIVQYSNAKSASLAREARTSSKRGTVLQAYTRIQSLHSSGKVETFSRAF